MLENILESLQNIMHVQVFHMKNSQWYINSQDSWTLGNTLP